MRKLFIFAVVACFVLVSCEKDKPENNDFQTEQKTKEPTFFLYVSNEYDKFTDEWSINGSFISPLPSVIPTVKFNEMEIVKFHADNSYIKGNIALPIESSKVIKLEVNNITDTTRGELTIPTVISNLRVNGNSIPLISDSSYTLYPDSIMSIRWDGIADFYGLVIFQYNNMSYSYEPYWLDTMLLENKFELNLSTKIDSFKFMNEIQIYFLIYSINGNMPRALPGEAPFLTGSYGDGYAFAETSTGDYIGILFSRIKNANSGINNNQIKKLPANIPKQDDIYKLYEKFLLNN